MNSCDCNGFASECEMNETPFRCKCNATSFTNGPSVSQLFFRFQSHIQQFWTKNYFSKQKVQSMPTVVQQPAICVALRQLDVAM